MLILKRQNTNWKGKFHIREKKIHTGGASFILVRLDSNWCDTFHTGETSLIKVDKFHTAETSFTSVRYSQIVTEGKRIHRVKGHKTKITFFENLPE